jgi:hypothetical protein
MNEQYDCIAEHFTNTRDVPKDHDLYYQCMCCGKVIPSVPPDNIGCECGKVFIDKDMWRLCVDDFDQFRVLRKKQKSN